MTTKQIVGVLLMIGCFLFFVVYPAIQYYFPDVRIIAFKERVPDQALVVVREGDESLYFYDADDTREENIPWIINVPGGGNWVLARGIRKEDRQWGVR